MKKRENQYLLEKESFDNAVKGLLGVDFEPIAYLGSQIVSGMNYKILCRSTVVATGAETALSVVTIYEDLNGEAKFMNADTIILGDTD